MSKKYDELTMDEKIERLLARPEVAVSLIDSQKELIDTLKSKIDIQDAMISIYKKLINKDGD